MIVRAREVHYEARELYGEWRVVVCFLTHSVGSYDNFGAVAQ